mmetsp:Transcript_7283/g.10429  ORF Transcript_7283/g.10429 Transcript_7283/m.10429 type:complete len:151 (-) Transcript_7283:163-615(-)
MRASANTIKTLPSIALIATIILAIFSDDAHAFSTFTCNPSFLSSSSISKTALNGFGDMFKGAFSNDESLGDRENAGLKGGPNYVEATINGKPVKAVANQKVSQVAAAARTKISYSCKKGDCGTCEISMNGRIVKACQAVIPNGKCNIKTF